ncbi:MAG: branched-chain amino acid ABC transporter permease [Deltaproteobacteria bacterium]|nr:branched-chain amino acid ABC transporter permease [Deltaproteobacteria bacterium]MBW2661578.1 branched-chain amino acid ABC transporter permease [Deltaproteobacteria bacterium]
MKPIKSIKKPVGARFSRDKIYYIFFSLAVILTGLFVDNSYYLQVLTFIGINSILALSLNMLMGYAGQISLGHAAFYGIGAYTTAILTAHYSLSPWLALPCAIFIAIFVAFLIGIPTLKLTGFYLGMGTLGFGMIVNIIFREWTSLTGGASGFIGIPSLELGPVSFDSMRNYFYFVWLALLLSIIICKRLVNSRIGRALRSIHDNIHAAEAVGINTRNLKLQVFMLSAAFAALAGFLYAHLVSFISPGSFDFMMSVRVVTMVVIGGMASIWGSLLGASLLTLLPEWLHAFSEFEMVVYGLILMLIMIVLPQGLTKGLIDIYERSKKKHDG